MSGEEIRLNFARYNTVSNGVKAGEAKPAGKSIDLSIFNGSINNNENSKTKELDSLIDAFLKLTFESEFTDKHGNLKDGVSPQVALNEDGTLKKGWSVDENGNTHFSRVKTEARSLDFTVPDTRDDQFYRPDPGFPPEKEEIGPADNYINVPVYELRNGKLVQTGTTTSFDEDSLKDK